MLPSSLPSSVTELLVCFRGCFTALTFTTFCGLACGFWAQPGLHTVTGMLIGARLQQAWHHSRAHRFFAVARWSADQLGLVLLDLICALLVADGAPLRLGTDDTLARRAARRTLAPWYQTKATPSAADMPAALRRVLLASQYRHGQASAPTMAEILQVQAAWAAAAA